MERPGLILATFIACTAEALWEALTLARVVAACHFASSDVRGDLSAPGDRSDLHFGDGRLMLSHRVIAADRPRRLEVEFAPHWGGDESVSRCVYLIEPARGGVKLTVEHYGLLPSQAGIRDGWTRQIASLKTFLETGRTPRFEIGAPEPAGA